MNEIALTPNKNLIDLLFDGLDSQHSIRAYRYQLDGFRSWMQAEGHNSLSRRVIMAWKRYMVDEDFSASTINQGLTVIRSLAESAYLEGVITGDELARIKSVKSVKQHGRHFGTWLSQSQAQRLLNALKYDTSLSGKRNLALIALMLATGLRREEASGLKADQLVKLGNGRYVIHNLIGKGNRVRTIPVPAWALGYLAAWLRAAGIRDGLVFRAVNKAGELSGPVRTNGGGMTDGGLSAGSVYNVIKSAGQLISIDLDPHDLRRTCAQLMHRSGADIAQIKEILGHASIRTTELYLGIDLDTDNPANDLIKLR